MEITGRIKKVYADKGTWASILINGDDGETYRAAGKICGAVAGIKIKVIGDIQNTDYGEQIKVYDAKMISDDSSAGMIAYLSSGFIKGIGVKRAKLIVDRFGKDTSKIIEETPEKLAEISGITPERAITISEAYVENREYLKIIDLLGSDATMHQVQSIFDKYGKDSVNKLKENPYTVIYELDGFGFKRADMLAAAMGISGDDERRVAAAITYTLKTLASDGHCFCRTDAIEACMRELIQDVPVGRLADVITDEIEKGHLVLEGDKLYIKSLWNYEEGAAAMIAALVKSPPIKTVPDIRIDTAIKRIESRTGFELDVRQKEAISFITKNRLCIVTGGPGTGKTTIIKGIIDVWGESENTILVAPTGRAAKRMSELTEMPASTIQRLLLEYKIRPAQYKNCRALVIADESSMLDIALANALLKFVTETHSSLVLIGDIYQLPPIGPGNFFRDAVQSPCVPTISLELSFRQSGKIAINAKKINAGEGMHSYVYDDSFKFVSANKENMQEKIIAEYMKLYKKYPVEDICCITPIRKDTKNNKRLTSANALNLVIRDLVNPPKKGDKQLKGCSFRIGDRVMQTVNDAKKWVMNGDCGIVSSISEEENCIYVKLDDGRTVDYSPSEANQLVFAYAATVHKSQGSEYEAVVMAQGWEHYKLLQRTLLYTGVTRARKQVVLVGDDRAINLAVRTIPNMVRNTQLRAKIGREVSK